MTKCPLCKSEEIEKAKYDSGHFKTDKKQPVRMYQYRCNGCGFVATMAKEGGQP